MTPLLVLLAAASAAPARLAVPPAPRFAPSLPLVRPAPGQVPSLAPSPVVPSLAPAPSLSPLFSALATPPAGLVSPAAPELQRLAASLALLPPSAPSEARPLLDAAFDAAPAYGYSATADAPLPESVPAPAPRLLDRLGFADSLAAGRLSFGAELRSPDPVSAATLAGHPGVAAVFVDASAAPRGRVSALVNAVSRGPAVVVGRFRSADDPGLKPRLDEGLLGATLENPRSLREVLRFLRRLYVPPLGRRSVGPSDVTDWLDAVPEFTAKNNAAFAGGVTVADSPSAAAIGSIVKAKARGLKFVEVDARALTPAEVAAVETAARSAGLPLVGRAPDRAAAAALAARGYRHVVVTDEDAAVDAAFAAYENVPADAALEPAAGWLQDGRVGHVSFLMSPDPVLARALAARSHAILLDGESGHFTPEAVARVVRALPPGFPALVRLSGSDDPALAAYLEAGAAGLVAPQVATAREAADFVAAVAAAKPGARAVVMVENRRGLTNAEAIAATPGLSAVFIGPYDLALSMERAPETPEFKAAVARIEAAARAAGVPLGGLAKTRAQAYGLRGLGYGFVLGVADQPALAARLRAALAPAAAPVSLAPPADAEFRRARGFFLAIAGVAAVGGASLFGWLGGLGSAAAYLTTYAIELALSVDNLMAFTLIFSQLSLPKSAAKRILKWGLLAALVLRVVAVVAGAQAIAAVAWAIPAGGVVLLGLGAKMLLHHDDGPKESRLVSFLSERLRLGPATVALLGVILVDVVFAVDSVPTALGISQDLPLIIAANVFSVLGLSQLYVLLQRLMGRFHLVPKGVGLSLLFIGLKMLAGALLGVHIGPLLSLAAVGGLIGGSVLLSARRTR